MNDSKTTVPVMVLNPLTGQQIDVLPLLKLINHFNDNPVQVAGLLDGHIQDLVCSQETISTFGIEGLKIYELYLLRDAFSGCTIKEGSEND
ncbi:MAG: hypothetical protein RBR21_07885 [Bacteroidales bacterium]|nr:hypothetical protein [Bacteroidales bacterium]